MRIIDRYILKSILGLFFLCILIFMLMYIIIDAFSNLDNILKQKTAINTLIQYYLAYLPIIFVQVAPMTCLLSTLYTFGKLNRDNEIIVMRASGLSIFQITKTVFMFGLLVSLLVFWVSDKFVPQSLALTQKIREDIESGAKLKQEKQNEVIENLSMYGMKNRLFFVNKFLPSSNTMEGITILEHDEHQNLTKKIVASKGIYKEGIWRFYQTITYDFDEDSQLQHEPQFFEEEIMTIPETPHEFLTQRQKPDFMTISQLEDYLWKLSKSGATTVIRNLKVDLYQRFTAPFNSIIIMLLGIPFALKMRRRATGLSSIGLSIMMGFLYYVVNAVSIAFGKGGILIPILSASLSQILALLASMYLISILP